MTRSSTLCTASAPSRRRRWSSCPTISPRTASRRRRRLDGGGDEQDGREREERVGRRAMPRGGQRVIPPGPQGGPEHRNDGRRAREHHPSGPRESVRSRVNQCAPPGLQRLFDCGLRPTGRAPQRAMPHCLARADSWRGAGARRHSPTRARRSCGMQAPCSFPRHWRRPGRYLGGLAELPRIPLTATTGHAA